MPGRPRVPRMFNVCTGSVKAGGALRLATGDGVVSEDDRRTVT